MLKNGRFSPTDPIHTKGEKMEIIGYIRVSSSKQSLTHQKFEIQKFCKQNGLKVNKWIEETISSRKSLQKRKLGNLLKDINENNILIACEISRFGRSLLEVMHILEVCLNKNCQIWTIKENYRLGNDIQSKVMAFAFALAAEIERNLISQRTKSSLENIKGNGKKLGRPLTKAHQLLQQKENKEKILCLLNQGVSQSEIARIMKVNRHILRRFLLNLKSTKTDDKK